MFHRFEADGSRAAGGHTHVGVGHSCLLGRFRPLGGMSIVTSALVWFKGTTHRAEAGPVRCIGLGVSTCGRLLELNVSPDLERVGLRCLLLSARRTVRRNRPSTLATVGGCDHLTKFFSIRRFDSPCSPTSRRDGFEVGNVPSR